MNKRIRLNENDIENLVKKIIKENEDYEERGGRYMFFSNLEQLHRQTAALLDMDQDMIEEILEDGHDWAQDHIAEAKNNMDQVFDFLMNEIEGEGGDYDYDEDEMIMEPQLEAYLRENADRIIHVDEFGFTELLPLNEAKGKGACANRGLGKPWLTPGGPKKRSVCVKNPSGNVVKVNFGDPNMRIKKSNPARRKSFRARHKCSTPGPRHKPRYWSCKAW